ncbi:Hcp family type VI secretion system effector [Roseomonas xinghualingensis]|uniref:Hcp family type VI secretion system effector n=1 Tax=Roseomonas xinghualingensis TaxID=2986475 RepID=UPI0021F154D2|nr:type VI secretion system tube protein Hcp [Roseomonas sp. SXEYE001]MCV4209675.1 type VI secretion system tube protein Hcp [Roseomonas sp. SXEYE001]
MAIYMKFGKIDGQVTTEGYKNWIELHSFQLGVGRGVTSGAGGQARESSNPNISEISVTKTFDVSSSGLFEDSVAGTFNTKVEIKFTSTTKSKVDTFLAYELTDCGVSSYSVSSSGDNPVESLSLNFTKIMVSPSPLDNAGTPKAGAKVTYDLAAMKKS